MSSFQVLLSLSNVLLNLFNPFRSHALVEEIYVYVIIGREIKKTKDLSQCKIRDKPDAIVCIHDRTKILNILSLLEITSFILN